ncbi:MAG TPA: hypothetical protein V6D02_04530 [Candidatus Obscuribacterales bacterium]
MTSLHSFCKTHQLAKSTVHSFLTSEGFDLSQGMTPAAIAAAKIEFNIQPEQPQPPQQQPTTYRAGGLVPVEEGTFTRTIGLFDAQSYAADKQALESNARHQAAGLNEMVAQYAQSRIAAVLADIDLVADSVRANALQAMGQAPGKPQAPTDGHAA